MRRPLVLLLVLVFAAPASHARRRASSHPEPFTLPAIEALAAEALQAGVPGLTISIRQGNSYLTKSWGNTRNDTVYQIGSVTKQFTAAAIMRLVEAGKLNTTDKARTWIPELDARFDAITIEHLLTHRSGIREYTTQITNAFVPKSQSEILALITSGPPAFTPGAGFTYSNAGYYLLGMIIERASSMTYEQYLRATFFDPLALRDTSYCGTTAPSPGGYVIDQGGNVFEVASGHMSIPFAAGALCSTGDDLLRWTGALSTGRAVSPSSYARMTTNAGASYGYALIIDSFEGRRRIWHNGAILGFESAVMHFPDDETMVVVLINALDLRPNHRATDIAAAVARAVR